MMKLRSVQPHCVYVVSSSRNDYFSEMTAVSIESLRLSNPDCKITIVVDDLSEETKSLKAARNLSDVVIEVSSRYTDQVYRSRDLKVRLRQIVDGPFLYLDSDTMILRGIDELFSHGHDIAAVRDYPENRSNRSYSRAIFDETKRIGWSLGKIPYLNSGVFYMGDGECVYKMAERINSNWRLFCMELGRANDQPAFNQAIFEQFEEDSFFKLHIFDHRYNAQVSMDPRLGRNASIFHIFSGSFQDRRDTVLHVEAHRLKCEGYIDTPTIHRAIDEGHPWVQLDSPKKLIAHRGYLAGASEYLVSRLVGWKI
jgi:lipopolysaccharide biosynthesis glycosyltransferase